MIGFTTGVIGFTIPRRSRNRFEVLLVHGDAGILARATFVLVPAHTGPGSGATWGFVHFQTRALAKRSCS